MAKAELWEASCGGWKAAEWSWKAPTPPESVVIGADVHGDLTALCSLHAEPCVDLTAAHNPVDPFHREGS